MLFSSRAPKFWPSTQEGLQGIKGMNEVLKKKEFTLIGFMIRTIWICNGTNTAIGC